MINAHTAIQPVHIYDVGHVEERESERDFRRKPVRPIGVRIAALVPSVAIEVFFLQNHMCRDYEVDMSEKQLLAKPRENMSTKNLFGLERL